MTAEHAPWGKLIALEKDPDGSLKEKDAIELCKTETTIGRCQDCDVPHPNNKLLSGFHCKIRFSREDRKIDLLDTSKNGTLVNCKKVKMTEVELSDGDIIHCAHKKTEPELYVIYRIEIARKDIETGLKHDEESTIETQQYNTDSDDTQEYIALSKKNAKKRAAKSKASLEPENKKLQKSDSCDSECHPKPSQDQEGAGNDYDYEMEQNLICSICQDIFHDCVSVQPCMHSFCGACFSEWMEQSDICPTCRKKGKKVAKNHIVNNLVAAFLSKHPDRKRSDEELQSMDAKNKIKNEVLNINTDEADSMPEDDDMSDDSEHSLSYNISSSGDYQNLQYLFRAPSTFSRPFGSRCRQCPNSFPQNNSLADNQDNSTNQFTCAQDQSHIFCCCCQEQFPDRRKEKLPTQDAACSSKGIDNTQKVQCTSCGKFFCHLYWGCRKLGCLGCLNKFKDFNFGRSSLQNLLNNNPFESNILLQYLDDKSTSISACLYQCVAKLESREFTVPSRPGLSGDDIVCYSCGLKYFGQLAYQYRSSLLAEDLPAHVTQRSNCYWGRNCRTQRHNASHASRYNHICDQTRY